MSSVTAKQSDALAHYRTLFEERFQGDPLLEQRRSALERFLSAGFPTQRDEAWKYTSLRRIESRAFRLGEQRPVAIATAPWIEGAGYRVVFLNGRWAPSLSAGTPLPPGATLVTLGEWLKHAPDEALAYTSRAGQAEASALEHLNAAFFEDGIVLQLSKDAILDEAIHVVHLWTGVAEPAMSHPRILVRADRNSRCVLVEQFVALADAEAWTNAVTAIELEPNASVRHYRLQQESTRAFHTGHVTVHVRDNARYDVHDLSFGAALSRVNTTVFLEGSGAHAELHGLLAPVGSQHHDAHTRIEHIAPHTTSSEEYRGIAAGRGRGVFNGKVLVHPGAQKTDARQSSRNLLLSATAEIDAKPELEIYANDVKCSHGATTGQLDATALFYLRSRGLSEDEARVLLIRAFAEALLSSIEQPRVHDYLEALLAARFGSAPVTP